MSALCAVTIERRDPYVVASLDGEVDMSNSAELQRTLMAAVTNDAQALVVDLTRTSYLDSIGVHLLFELRHQMTAHRQVLLVVAAPASPVRRVLEIVNLGRHVAVHHTVGDALGQFEPGGRMSNGA